MPPEDRKLAAAATAPAKPAADESVARSLARLHGAAEAIVSATGQAIYVWDIASDAIEWSGNFARLIGLDAGETRHLKGRSFEAMLSSRSQETRFGVVVSAAEAATARAPVPYQCVYLLHPDAAVEKPPLWIEDTGCWYPGENGKPVRAQGSVRIINERRSREEDLRRQSDFDDLTGLPNRRSLERQLDAAIRDAEHRGTVSTFLILSIDRLDTINDVFGFGHGDRVLREAGRRIQAKLRADDVVCRLSGAKFGLILRDCPPAEVFDAAQRVIAALAAEPVDTGDGRIPVNAVVGACFLPRHAANAAEAMGTAFRALRKAHGEVSTRISVFSADPTEDALNRRKAALSFEILEALDKDALIARRAGGAALADGTSLQHIELFYQEPARAGGTQPAPLDLSVTGRELGLMRPLDHKLLQATLAALGEEPGTCFMLDVSRDTILEAGWMAELASGLAAGGIAPQRLVIGLAEAFALGGRPEAEGILRSIRSLGCRITISRFSVSPEAIARLSHVPADFVMPDPAILELVPAGAAQRFPDHLAAAFDLVRAMGFEVISLPAGTA